MPTKVVLLTQVSVLSDGSMSVNRSMVYVNTGLGLEFLCCIYRSGKCFLVPISYEGKR